MGLHVDSENGHFRNPRFTLQNRTQKEKEKERSVLDGGPGVSLPHKVDAITTAMSRAARQ